MSEVSKHKSNIKNGIELPTWSGIDKARHALASVEKFSTPRRAWMAVIAAVVTTLTSFANASAWVFALPLLILAAMTATCEVFNAVDRRRRLT